MSNVSSSFSIWLQSPVVFTPQALHFGALIVGHNATQSVTITNSGTSTLTFAAFSITGANAADFALTNNCPATLSAGTNCQVTVGFTATMQGKTETASLQISSNGPVGTVNIPISAMGTFLVATPHVANFGMVTVGTTDSKNLSITNTGTTALTFKTLKVNNDLFGEFSASVGSCAGTLAAGATCHVNAKYTPGVVAPGIASVTVTFNNDAITIPLKGTGQ